MFVAFFLKASHRPPIKGNLSIFFNVAKNTLLDISDKDKLTFKSDKNFGSIIDAEESHFSKNFTEQYNYYMDWYGLTLERRTSAEEIRTIEQTMMPGFNLNWHWKNDRKGETDPVDAFKTDNSQFTR